MEHLALLIVGGVIFWAVGVVKNHPKPKHPPKEPALPYVETQQTALHERDTAVDQPLPVDQDTGIHCTRIRWSGTPHGPFPTSQLSINQWVCLNDAIAGKRIVGKDPTGSSISKNIAVHPMRTINTLVKHGYLVPQTEGVYVCSDFGAEAYERLPAKIYF